MKEPAAKGRPLDEDVTTERLHERLAYRQAELSQLRAKNRQLEHRLDSVVRSTTWRLGEAIVRAARSPARSLPGLPFEIRRIFHDRRRAAVGTFAAAGLVPVGLDTRPRPAKPVNDRARAWLSAAHAPSSRRLLDIAAPAEALLALSDESRWIEVPVDGVAELLVACSLHCGTDPAAGARQAVARIEFLDVRGRQAARTGAISSFELPGAIDRKTVFAVRPPAGSAKARVGFCNPGNGRQAKIRNGIGLSALRMGISVIVPTCRGEATIEACLVSIAGQSLGPAMFEVIVVVNGERDGTADRIEAVRRKYPGIDFRVLELDEAGAGSARNRGIEAASREFIAFIDDDDTISADYLSALYRHAGPDTITISQILDVVDGFVHDSPVGRQVREAAEAKRVRCDDLALVLTMNACKLVPAFYAKQLAFDVALRSGEDVHFHTHLCLHFSPEFKAVPAAEGAVYYRTRTTNSRSRQPVSFEFNVAQRLDVMRAIDAILHEARTDDKANLAAGKITAQAQFVVDYLKGHPDDYPRFRALVSGQRYRCSVVRWINAKLAGTLVIARGIRPTEYAQVVLMERIRDVGHPVDVITIKSTEGRWTDECVADNRLGDAIEVDVEDVADWKAVEAFADAALGHALRLEEHKDRYSTLYSQVAWPASTFAAVAYKLRNPAVHWIAEVSDTRFSETEREQGGEPLNRAWLARNGVLDALHVRGGAPPETPNLRFWNEYLPYQFADELVFPDERRLQHALSTLTRPELIEAVGRKAVVGAQLILPTCDTARAGR